MLRDAPRGPLSIDETRMRLLPVNITYHRLHAAINRRLYRVGHGRFAGLCRPSSPTLLLTERCNARCIHCDIWKNRGAEERPALADWKRLLTELRNWLGPVQVVLTGGEALLNPHTIELIAHGRSLGLWIELLSHGYWKDQSKIEELIMAHPSRVTISLDSVNETHNLIRGRNGFVDQTKLTIQTLTRLRKEQQLKMEMLLKTVIMRQNLEQVCAVAHFANEHGLKVFYQPIEQNYNTVEDPEWFRRNETWPDDPLKAANIVRQLCELKQQGLPIANSLAQLKIMIPYFLDPAASRIAIQSHTAHERDLRCSAATMLQIQANGDVNICTAKPPVGNIKSQSIREIWRRRPYWWQAGCCLQERMGQPASAGKAI